MFLNPRGVCSVTDLRSRPVQEWHLVDGSMLEEPSSISLTD
jgi:hypothetical protein